MIYLYKTKKYDEVFSYIYLTIILSKKNIGLIDYFIYYYNNNTKKMQKNKIYKKLDDKTILLLKKLINLKSIDNNFNVFIKNITLIEKK